MRQHYAVFALYIRGILPRLLLLLAALSAVELLGFRILGLDRLWSFGAGDGDHFLAACFFAAYGLTLLLCLWTGRRSGALGDTLRRLRISERAVFLWHALTAFCALLLLWGVQILLVYGLAKGYAAGEGYAGGPQGVFVDLLRSPFFHGLLPLDETALWVRNLLCALMAGTACGTIALRLRHGESSPLSILLLTILPLTFPAHLSIGFGLIILRTGAAALFTAMMAAVSLRTAHPGRGEKEEERRGNEDETPA